LPFLYIDIVAFVIPSFFDKNFVGARVVVSGTVELCPTQHGYVAQGIAHNAGINVSMIDYAKLPYVNIHKINLNTRDNTYSLLGTPWAVTDDPKQQYLLQYGYLDRQDELSTCLNKLQSEKSWKNMRVFYDDLKAPSAEVSFKQLFL